MEFWGVEVKPGASLKVTPEENKLIHISQAALGEVKNTKGAESVPLRLKIDDGKFVLGTLAAVARPQVTFDLVFEKEFELSHDWKNGSVYFCGYTADNPDGEDEMGPYDFGESDESDQVSSEDDEEITLDPPHGNGKVEPKVEKAKPAKLAAAPAKPEPAKPEPSTKSKAAPAPKKEADDSDDEEDSDEDDSDDAAEFGSDDDMSEDDDSDDSDDDDEDEETPKKPVSAKKRPSESASKTPVQAKKAKVETPQKTDGKKSGGHVATPHPAKKAEKTPASKNKGKEQSPKSGANIKCGSCSKTFNSDGALQSHSKAKHSAAK